MKLIVSLASGLIASAVGFATTGGGSHTESPYPTLPPATTVPASLGEGACQLVGLDYALADPTFIDPSEDRVIGVTAFIEVNPSSTGRMICPLRLDPDTAERLYDLLDSMINDGIVPGELPTVTTP